MGRDKTETLLPTGGAAQEYRYRLAYDILHGQIHLTLKVRDGDRQERVHPTNGSTADLESGCPAPSNPRYAESKRRVKRGRYGASNSMGSTHVQEPKRRRISCDPEKVTTMEAIRQIVPDMMRTPQHWAYTFNTTLTYENSYAIILTYEPNPDTPHPPTTR